jgi:uncharacterized protein (TIGR02246 family)
MRQVTSSAGTCLIVWLLLAKFAAADQASTQQINQLFVNLNGAFALRSADQVASLWLEQGELITLAGGVLKGRESIKESFAEAFGGPYKAASFQYLVQYVRFVGNIAVVDGIWKVTNGPQNYPSCGIFLDNLVSEGGTWKIEMSYSSVPKTGHTAEVGRTLSWTKLCKQ